MGSYCYAYNLPNGEAWELPAGDPDVYVGVSIPFSKTKEDGPSGFVYDIHEHAYRMKQNPGAPSVVPLHYSLKANFFFEENDPQSPNDVGWRRTSAWNTSADDWFEINAGKLGVKTHIFSYEAPEMSIIPSDPAKPVGVSELAKPGEVSIVFSGIQNVSLSPTYDTYFYLRIFISNTSQYGKVWMNKDAVLGFLPIGF